MKISLDRLALKALIDADPEFELELKNAVISEIGRRFFEKDAKRVIAAAEPELFAQALKSMQDDTDLSGLVHQALKSSLTMRNQNWYGRVELAPDVKAKINDHVEEMKVRVISGATAQIETAFREAIKKAVDARLAATDIDERIEKRVDRLIEQEINQRADERFKARMADIKAMIS